MELPPYEQAIAAFEEFLAQEGWPPVIVWRRPDDVVRRVGKDIVVRRRSSREANAWARRYYETGHAQGLGIALGAECEIDGAVCATMFWIADDQEAVSRMMPAQGLKMSAALLRARGQSVSWLGWWLAKKKTGNVPQSARRRGCSQSEPLNVNGRHAARPVHHVLNSVSRPLKHGKRFRG